MALALSFPGNVFPLGTHVYREPHQDQEELHADLPLLAKLGFNMIKIQEIWAFDEPSEGSYDFARIERLMERAGALGLGVYLGLTMEEAPAWLWQKYPDCSMVYADGQSLRDPIQSCLPSDGKPGPCWDHPGARQAAERFIGEAARRLGRFENLWVWNTWQEIGFWPHEGGTLSLCYCPHSLERFRAWLEERYGSLEALNRAWATAFGAWDVVMPSRRFAANPPFTDWRYYMDDVYLTRALEWKTRALKVHDPARRPVFSHVASPANANDNVRFGSGALWRWARTGDLFGNSNYPAWARFHRWDDVWTERSGWHASALLELWESMMFRGDLTRSAAGPERPFWGAEFQGGPISTLLHLGRTPNAADIRRWMLAGLASGMHGISFWNHRAERAWQECNGFGLLDPEGTSTERIEEAARIGRAINVAPAIFAQGRTPRAEVALLISEDLFHFCQATGETAADLLSYNLRGHYARLWRLGFPIDFVEEEEVRSGALAGYKAAILPMPLMLEASFLECLRRFVAEGGTLISEACPGRFDRYGFATRGQMAPGAEELFGARHSAVRIVREPAAPSRWTPEERGFGEFVPPTVLAGAGAFAGSTLRAGFYLQTLTPTTGETILLAGAETAGVRHSLGHGTAVLLGTFSGLCATAHIHLESDAFFEHLLAEAGVRPDRCGSLLRRRRVLDETEAWFLINPATEAATERLSVDGNTSVRDLLGDSVIDTAPGGVTVRVPAANIACLILAHRRPPQ